MKSRPRRWQTITFLSGLVIAFFSLVHWLYIWDLFVLAALYTGCCLEIWVLRHETCTNDVHNISEGENFLFVNMGIWVCRKDHKGP